MGIHPLVESLELFPTLLVAVLCFLSPGAVFKARARLMLIFDHRAVSPAVILIFFWCVLVDYICGWRSEVSRRCYSPGATHLVVVVVII